MIYKPTGKSYTFNLPRPHEFPTTSSVFDVNMFSMLRGLKYILLARNVRSYTIWIFRRR